MCVSVCLSFCVHDYSKIIGQATQNFNTLVVYDTSLNKFNIGPSLIKAILSEGTISAVAHCRKIKFISSGTHIHKVRTWSSLSNFVT